MTDVKAFPAPQGTGGRSFVLVRSAYRDIGIILLFGFAINAVLISTPGYFSHDELGWINMIEDGRAPWSFGLGSFSHSNFFRLLGTIFISASLRLPDQPVDAHFVEVVLAIASACFLYRAVSLFRPDRALAAALLFMVMPGFAFDVGWVAAGFDVQFTLWGIVSTLYGILYWRGGRPWALVVSALAFVAATCCKETALSIPICAAIVMWIDRKNVDRSRAAILVCVIVAIVVMYFGLSWRRILHVGAAGSGGYAFGRRWEALHNAIPYFGFPFAYKLTEITNFPVGDVRAELLLCLPHVVLVGLILARGGVKWALIYLVAFFATLLPVLPISKFETQYDYAASVTLAIALAVVWSKRISICLPVVLLALVLVAHSILIQHAMYQTGACQTHALETVESTMKSSPTADNAVILISDVEPWWVLERAIYQNRFMIGGQTLTASVTHDAGAANMVFNSDCSVTLKHGS